MQIVYLALAFGSASAFVAPAAQAASSQLRSTPAEEIGVPRAVRDDRRRAVREVLGGAGRPRAPPRRARPGPHQYR